MSPGFQQLELTKSQVNKAGRLLRKFDPSTNTMDDLYWGYNVVEAFRAAHRKPLHTAYSGLRSGCDSSGIDANVTQRLKRWATIAHKLQREPTLQLANMQDIGGCRSVVATVADLRRLEGHLRRYHKHKLDTERCRDYIEQPKPSGYRGIHLIIFYHGCRIEWQLRTFLMHDWAIAIERLGPVFGEDLKNGVGPAEVHEWLRLISDAMGYEDRGEVVPDDLVLRVQQTRQGALPFIK